MTNESTVYMNALKSLEDVVSSIRNMQKPDVDVLVPLVEKGLKARAICLDRIQAVQNKLNEISDGD